MSGGTSWEIEKATIASPGTLSLLRTIVEEDKARGYIWSISDNARLWTDDKALREYMARDFGDCLLYQLCGNASVLGLGGMCNLRREGADLLMWIHGSVRKHFGPMIWFIQMLSEAQNHGVPFWYARIKVRNEVSLRAARRLGFSAVSDDGRSKATQSMGRSTEYLPFEKAFVARLGRGVGFTLTDAKLSV